MITRQSQEAACTEWFIVPLLLFRQASVKAALRSSHAQHSDNTLRRTLLARRITARLRVLPLVSRRWARIMRTSADVWQQACLDLPELVTHVVNPQRPQRPRLDMTTMTAWFHAHPGRFQRLRLTCTDGSMSVTPVLTCMLLGTQTASLRSLSVDLLAFGLRAPELGVIVALQGLTALRVRVAAHGLKDRGVVLLRAASRLPALSQLEIIAPDGPLAQPDMLLPRCQQLRELRSQSLQRLSICMASGTEDELRLGQTPNLRHCDLFAQPNSVSFKINADSFEGCASMEQVTLQYQQALSLQPHCFEALSGVTSLALVDCGLLAVPSAITPLTLLHSLDISQNEHLVIDETSTIVLRMLKMLRKLDVARREPAVHSLPSLQALFDLVDDFRNEGLHLRVNLNPTCSETFDPEDIFSGASAFGD